MIIAVDHSNLTAAAQIHSIAWQESHRSFCSPDYIAAHTPQRQEAYLLQKMAEGSRLYLLVEDTPIGIVSVTGSRIEDLYILPDHQNKGCGTELLRYAIAQITGVPTLWILENNKGAERLYRRLGFKPSGRRLTRTNGLDEIEFELV